MRRDVDRVYTSTEAIRATGVTYRQLDYWASIDFIVPTVKNGKQGHPRGYSREDIEQLKLTKALLDVGVSLPAIRRVGPEKMVHILRTFLRQQGDLY